MNENGDSLNDSTTGVTLNTGGTGQQTAPDGVTTILDGGTAAQPEQTGQPGQNAQAAQTGAPRAPEQYGPFTLPEGVDAQSETVRAALDEAGGVFKEMGLTQEQAQKLIDLHMKHWTGGALEAEELFQKQVDQRVKDWGEQLRNDPEIGGAKLNENLMYARRAVSYLGGRKLMDALNDTGTGSHPVIVAAFVKAGRDFFREGRFIQGSSAPSARDNSPEAVAARVYPNMIKN